MFGMQRGGCVMHWYSRHVIKTGVTISVRKQEREEGGGGGGGGGG
jgi:hypothetical protein